ncbi:hypothetical protein INR49_022807 [Caranx melampygus]|nr:hypothetical protein INR49_022807 [Caranx melampygus]
MKEEKIPQPAGGGGGGLQDEDEDEDEGELALWSPDVQDPLDPGRCVMVIRSLVPGGSAEHHGGLLPGDQLVSVNQTQLDLLTLAQAVEEDRPERRREELMPLSKLLILPDDLLHEAERRRRRRRSRADPGRRSPRYATSSLTQTSCLWKRAGRWLWMRRSRSRSRSRS